MIFVDIFVLLKVLLIIFVYLGRFTFLLVGDKAIFLLPFNYRSLTRI